ncbi:MAG: Arc family DNA-binding protein [Clostridia bacterium]|nr:Arc family DNA-binding protein [Clostridia bacterium]
MAVKSVSIRIEEEMLKKIGSVADYEGRSLNSHILVLIRENIQAFEAKHGKIEESFPGAENVKPPRKSKP